MHYNRIIMFCDYGLDDAIATVHILTNADYEKLITVPIGGNVDVVAAYRNAHTLLAAAKADKAKTTVVDTRAIKQYAAHIPDIHGGDGMGDLLDPTPSDIPVIDFDGLKNLIATSSDPVHDCVLSLGPCTLPNMLAYSPFCTVLMGGRTKEKPNFGDYEFNEACDVAAFRAFAGGAAAVATLDSCHDKKFGFEKMHMNSELGDRLTQKYITLCKNRNAPVAVYDYVAALAVTNPEKFEAEAVLRDDGVRFNELHLISL